MPRLPKKRRAAKAREEFRKLPHHLKDPLSWTFEDPWNSDFLREPVSTTPPEVDIHQPSPHQCAANDVARSGQNSPDSGDGELEPLAMEQCQLNHDPPTAVHLLPCPEDVKMTVVDVPILPEHNLRALNRFSASESTMGIRQDDFVVTDVQNQVETTERIDEHFGLEDTIETCDDELRDTTPHAPLRQSDDIYFTGWNAAPVGLDSPAIEKDVSCSSTTTTNESMINDALTNRDVKKSSNLVVDLEYNGIRLSKSKTTIINIAGLVPGQIVDREIDCFCAACKKWAEFQRSAIPNKAKLEHASDTSTVTPEAEPMDNMYRSFNSLKPKKKFFRRIGCVPIGNCKRGSTKKILRQRLKAIDGDMYTKVEMLQNECIEGRRIIDLEYFVKWLTMAQAVHSQKCKGVLCTYQEDFNSMISTLYLKCNVCSAIVCGYSEKPTSKKRLRHCIDWAILCSGGTYTMAEEFFSFLNMPFTPKNTFIRDETAMDEIIEAALEESMNNSIEAEKDAVRKELAQNGRVLHEDKPIESCAALDGSWGQRSNGHRYNSASGCAAIIGIKSKKVCYVGCRNKRCIACTFNVRRAKNKLKIRSHKCYRNYKGASGGMEPDIIIEGFEKLRKKGIKFSTVITDGDSTTVARLKNKCKYGSEIRHQLCCNHAMKSLGKRLRDIKCPKQFSDTVSKSIDRITRGIRSAIKHCADESNGKDVEGLRHDIRNAPFHAFGCHDDCRPYFCQNKESATESNGIISDLKGNGVWDKIMLAVEKTAAKAEFLSENRTSNLVENLYCRLSKYNVGKRVDTMSRGSYQRRVFITVLQHNEGYKWHDKYMYEYTGEHPGYWLRRMFQRKTASFLCTKKAQNSPGFVRRKLVPYDEIEKDYGIEAVEALEQGLEVACDTSNIKDRYELSDSVKQLLKLDLTISQMEELAFGRILSKYVPEIVSSRESTKHKKCDFMLQTTNTWNYLKTNRPIVSLVLRSLKDQHAIVLGGNRMYIDACHSYLCCVPDAVSDDGSMVLLIKKDQRKAKVQVVPKSKKKEQIVDKKSFNEAQAMMHICEASKCLIVMLNPNDHFDYVFHEVNYDEVYFNTRLLDKITAFFENFLSIKVAVNGLNVKS